MWSVILESNFILFLFHRQKERRQRGPRTRPRSIWPWRKPLNFTCRPRTVDSRIEPTENRSGIFLFLTQIYFTDYDRQHFTLYWLFDDGNSFVCCRTHFCVWDWMIWVARHCALFYRYSSCLLTMQRERQESVKEAAARNVRANPMPVQTKPAPVAHSSRELTGSVHCTCAQYLLDGIMHTIIRNWIFKYFNFAGNNHELNNTFSANRI